MARTPLPQGPAKIVVGQPGDRYEIALVLKLTYKILPDGSCAPAEEQEPILDDAQPYEKVEPPKVSPTRWDNDLFPFKEATDVVVQGSAHAYGRALPEVMVELRFQDVVRAVRATGDRACERSGGSLRFTPPVPFDRMPLRYERAFGGQDRKALERHGDPVAETIDFIRPEWLLSTTSPYHYPRNPAGAGYLIEADPESVEGLRLPNLDFPFDPVTPERLAVGSTERWILGPLPAGFDWYDQSWFPRIAYLGEYPKCSPGDRPPAEAARGWAPQDILTAYSFSDHRFDMPRFVQGASPGLSVKGVRPDEAFLLRNMFPGNPEKVVRLPGSVPRAALELKPKKKADLEPHLSTVAIRPDEGKLILVWSLRARVKRPYGPQEIAEMKYEIA